MVHFEVLAQSVSAVQSLSTARALKRFSVHFSFSSSIIHDYICAFITNRVRGLSSNDKEKQEILARYKL